MSDIVEIIPALMPRSFSELREQVGSFVGIVPIVQLDVMDGIFVPEKSWPYSENADDLREIVRARDAMPFWEDIDFEADLMIENPEQEIKNWILFGAARVIVHFESVRNMDFIISELRDSIYGKQTDGNREQHIELGIAINIDTPIEKIKPWIHAVDFVQCMGIARIGYQGQPFDARVLSSVARLREEYPDVIISVDGGVNFKSAPMLVAAGANRIVSGSLILGSDNFEQAIDRLRNSTRA